MRDRPFRTPRLEWPGGIVPEWAKAQQDPNKRRRGKGKPGQGGGAKRERLQKVMAQSGYGSRRNIEILIAQGHITINGQVAKLGDSVSPGDRVKLDGGLIQLRFGENLPRVLLYHKPEGELVTRDDPEGRPTVFAKLPKVNGGRWVSVGRLDYNTSGLLLFTTSGELANRLMHPRFEVEREYAVRLMGSLTDEQIAKLTVEGVEIEGENCKFDRLEDRGGEGANHWYHVVLREGKNREVRRMFEALALMVSRLMRVRYGPVPLPSFLKRGMMRDMPEADVVKLLAFAGMTEAGGEAPRPADEAGGEEDEDEVNGNVITDENRRPSLLDEIVDEDDDRQPAFLAAQPAFERPLVDGNRMGRSDFPPGAAKKPRHARKHGKGKQKPASAFPPQGHQARAPGQGQGKGPGRGKFRGKGRGQFQGQPTVPGQGEPAAIQGQGEPVGQGQPAALGQGQPPGQGQPAAQGQPPGQAKPGRHRSRNRNRNRNRGAGEARGEQQPASNGNRDPSTGGNRDRS
jgi:23S rRNA pseudouridine2605 synthase